MLTLSGDDSKKGLEKLFGIVNIRIDIVPEKPKPYFTIQFDKRDLASEVGGATADYFAFYYHQAPAFSDFELVKKATNQWRLPLSKKTGTFFLELVKKKRPETRQERTGEATCRYAFSFDLNLNTVQIETLSKTSEQRITQSVSEEKDKPVRKFSVWIANRKKQEALHVSFEASLRPKGVLSISIDRTKAKPIPVSQGLNEFDIPLVGKVKSARIFTFAFYLLKPGVPPEKVERFEKKLSEIQKEHVFSEEEERGKKKTPESTVSWVAPEAKPSSDLGPTPASPNEAQREGEETTSRENEGLQAGKTALEATDAADSKNRNHARFAETPAFDLAKPGGVENILSAILAWLNRFEEKFDNLTGSINELARILAEASAAKATDEHSTISDKKEELSAPSISKTLKKEKLAQLERDIDKDFASTDHPEPKPLIEWREKFQHLRRSFFAYMEQAMPDGLEKKDSEPFFDGIASKAVRKLDRIHEKLCMSGKDAFRKEVLGKELERADIADFDTFEKELCLKPDSDESEKAAETPDLTMEYEKYLNDKCEDVRERCLRRKDIILERAYRDEKQFVSDLENLIEHICTDFAQHDFAAIKKLHQSLDGERAKSPEEMDELLSRIFKLFWIEEIPVAPGVDTFNPEIHYDQQSTKDTRYPHMKVVQVLGQGYRIGLTGKTIRRVPVKVNIRA